MKSRRITAVVTAGSIVVALVPGSGETTTPTTPSVTETAVAVKAVRPAPARYQAQRIGWKPCGEPSLRVRCGTVTVPRDWNNPDAGVDLRIAVTKVDPKAGRGTRVVFGNPGGPGASGLGMAPFLAGRPGLKLTHTTVGFDPRGTGSSTNVSCGGSPLYSMDPRDRDAGPLKLVADASRMIVRYCASHSRGLLPFITTEQTVKDMDLIRSVLGYPTIDFVGFSAGTWMGAYYQKYFPQRAGRFVLDSNTDFTRPWNVTFEAQAQAFERRYRRDFAPWAAKYDDQLGLGRSPREVIRTAERLRADLKRSPVALDIGGFMLELDQNAVDAQIVQAMYSKLDFQPLAESLVEMRKLWIEESTGGPRAAQARFEALPAAARTRIAHAVRDAGSVRRPHVGPVPAGADATFFAVTCNDTISPRGQEYGDHVAGRMGPRYPLLGWAMNQNPCLYWDRPSLAMPVPDGRGVPTTLMVQSVHDPATSHALAVSAHRRYQGSRLVTVTGEGDHGVYGGVNPCTDAVVDKFLGTGLAPVRDVTCKGSGIPAPTPPEDHAAGAGRTAPLTRVADLSADLLGFLR